MAALVALVISVPTLRTTDFYFLMSTFAAAGLIVWTWNRLIHPFGGTSGIYGIPRPEAIAGSTLVVQWVRVSCSDSCVRVTRGAVADGGFQVGIDSEGNPMADSVAHSLALM